MTELLLETATDSCSVALSRDGKLLAEATATDIHQHASHLTLLIEEATERANCALAEVNALVLSDGPGSYTSLRVGAATAKGLCMALPGLRLITVPTLVALAGAVTDTGPADRIMATINSRRGEVFGQVFSVDTLEPLTHVLNVRLTDPQWRGKLLDGRALGRIVVCGPGQERVRDVLDGDNAFHFSQPGKARAAYLTGEQVRRFWEARDFSTYEPFYLNAPHVTKSKKKSLL